MKKTSCQFFSYRFKMLQTNSNSLQCIIRSKKFTIEEALVTNVHKWHDVVYWHWIKCLWNQDLWIILNHFWVFFNNTMKHSAAEGCNFLACCSQDITSLWIHFESIGNLKLKRKFQRHFVLTVYSLKHSIPESYTAVQPWINLLKQGGNLNLDCIPHTAIVAMSDRGGFL